MQKKEKSKLFQTGNRCIDIFFHTSISIQNFFTDFRESWLVKVWWIWASESEIFNYKIYISIALKEIKPYY